MASVKRSKALTMTVGTRMDFEEVARIDALARAAHLDRASYIRRVLLGRKVSCQREMVATMMTSPGADPLEHYILSWQAHERPDHQQVREAVAIFAETMGLADNQAIFAAHSNTAHYHVHIAINRVHPRTFERIAAGGDWQVDCMHQAIAMIEYRQGWDREVEALYEAREQGLFHRPTGGQVRDSAGLIIAHPTREHRKAVRDAKEASKDKASIEAQLSQGARAYARAPTYLACRYDQA